MCDCKSTKPLKNVVLSSHSFVVVASASFLFLLHFLALRLVVVSRHIKTLTHFIFFHFFLLSQTRYPSSTWSVRCLLVSSCCSSADGFFANKTHTQTACLACVCRLGNSTAAARLAYLTVAVESAMGGPLEGWEHLSSRSETKKKLSEWMKFEML